MQSALKRYALPIALGVIVLLAAALRLYGIGSVPTELDADEIDLYNSAYSIATTGHDVDGRLTPFLYSSTTRNPPMYAIAAYGTAAIFGRTPLGLRLPAVLFGLISIVLLYGITLELTRRRDLAVIAALLMATQPIFVHFARVGWEPASELPFLLGGIYLMLRGMRARRISSGLIFLGSFLLGLTAYTYLAGWFYALLLGGAILALNCRRYTSRRDAVTVAGASAIWLLVVAPALWMWFFDEHTASHTIGIGTFADGISPSSLLTFFLNYTAQFKWSYLVTTGDPMTGVTWRYLDGMGAFFGWVVPLALLGLVASPRYVRPRWSLIWTWFWLAVYPLGGALTNQGIPGMPNAPRTLAGAPVFCIFASIGIVLLFDSVTSLRRSGVARLGGIVARGMFALAIIFSTVYFARFYFTRYVHQNSNAWYSGTHELFADIRENSGGYKRICFNVRSAWYQLPSFVLFYMDGLPLRVIDNVNDPGCSLPGTLAAVDSDHPLRRAGFRTLVNIKDVDGNPFATLSGYR